MNKKTTIPFNLALYHTLIIDSAISPDFSIIAVLQGQAELTCNQTKRQLGEGELYLILPQDSFSIHVPKEPASVMAMITFQYNFFLKNIPNALPGLSLGREYFSQKEYETIFNRTLEFMDKYFDPNMDPHVYGNLNAYDYVSFLQEHALGHGRQAPEINKKEQRIFHIKDYIERNYAAAITLNDLADELQITPQYLATFIRQNLGVTFNQYLYKVRLSYAVRDLVNTQESITHIAFNYGFPNLSAFNRIFREAYHITPQNYRIQYTKNMELFNARPLSNPDLAKSREIYDAYKSKNQQKQKAPTHIYFDSKNADTLPRIWESILNVGYGKELNDFALIDQLRTIIRELHFQYGRVCGIVHPDIISYNEETKTYNFHKADTILDILYELRLTPFIVLGKPEPVFNQQRQPIYAYSSAEFNDFPKVFRAFIQHCIQRFSISNVEKWVFEYSYNMVEEGYFSKNQFYYSFIKNSMEVYHILKNVSQSIRFGGPGHRLAQHDHTLIHILEHWKKHGIFPDFITVNAYPIERVEKDGHPNIHRYSTDPHIHKKRLMELRLHLQELYSCEMPIYIIEMAYYFYNKKYLSDSRFSAAHTVYNIVDLCGLCEGAAVPAASDLHYQQLGNAQLLSGVNGMLTIDGIKKPNFFALTFLNNLGTTMLSRGENYLLTRHRDDSFRVILYNYKHLNNYCCSHPDYEISENNFNNVFTDELPETFKLHLGALGSGRYFVIEYTLTKDFGSILDKWIECGKGRNLFNHIILHLKEQINIHFIYHIVQVRQDTAITFSLDPHVVKLVSIFPTDWEDK